MPPRATLLHNPYLLGLLCYFLFGTHDAISKYLMQTIGQAGTVLGVQLGILLWLGLGCTLLNQRDKLRMHNPRRVALFSALNALTMLGFYLAVPLLPLVELFVIILLRPIFATALAAAMLKETPSLRQIAAILLGLSAALITFAPWHSTAEHSLLGILVALINPITSSVRNVLIRRDGIQESALAITFYSAALLAVVSLGVLGPPPHLPAPPALGGLLLAAGVFALAAFTSIKALQAGPVVILSLTQYSTLFWVGLYGVLFFGETPEPRALFGAALIFLSGAILYEKKARPAAPRA